MNPGTRLGPYEILGAAGAGGMGEVYRARDTRLERTVAIKVLPEQFAQNPDLRQRFEREARAISSLNHPHICTLHDVGHQDGIDYLVLEYLEGEPLSSRLMRGPLPVEQLLKTGIEIADALEKAHRQGIVHRDLKPGNVMLTKSGAKLLDFGLAKPQSAMAPASGMPAAITQTKPVSPITQQGTLVGTFQYMSPEQVEGKEADARSDIFALGAVLYEMATGKRAFEGKSAISVASAILEKEPEPISKVQPLTPPALEQVVKGCLAKDPEERFQTAHDVKLQLKWIAEGGSSAVGVAPPVAARRRHREWAAWGAAALALLAVVAAGLWMRASAPAPARPIEAYLPAPENTTFILSDDDSAGPAVISPNGTYVAFVAMDQAGAKRLWVRALSESAAKPIPGTEGTTYPFWSPDEKWIGFFADGKLKKAPVGGGPVLTLADTPRGRGGSWSEGGQILFTPSTFSGIWMVAAAGGPATQVTKLNEALHTTHRWPVWLPGGKRFLYLATSHAKPEASQENGIYVGSVDGRENRMLMPADGNVAVASGHLLFMQNGVLMAQDFDARRAELSGDPAPVAEGIVYNPGTWRAAFDASRSGVLVYQSGAAIFGSQLLWLSPDGKAPVKLGDVDRYFDVRLSPDGRRVAVTIGDPDPALWVYDVGRGVRTRFTFEGTMDTGAAWSPRGERIAFSQKHAGPFEIFTKDASGSGKEEPLLGGAGDRVVTDWSADGHHLLYATFDAPRASAIWSLPLTGEGKPQVFLQGLTAFGIYGATFSPDGKWVAYVSREGGTTEVYVTTFPEPHGKWQVSTAGGQAPRWRHDGKALFYLAPDRTIMEAPITFQKDSVQIGAVRPYVKTNAVTVRLGTSPYDVAPDGRVLVNSVLGEGTRTITVVVNWAAGLKK